MKTTRTYHFISANYGLDNIKHQRLKISQIDCLNDPFELWAVAQPKSELRTAFKRVKKQLAATRGVLCFSLSCRNPLLWSHYADRHRGIVLGFDVENEMLERVKYVKERPILKEINIELARSLLLTKYLDWQYEQEARVFTTLQDPDSSGRYFVPFSEKLSLREVIVGPLSSVTKKELNDALGSVSTVSLKKTRLAFKTFEVVTDRRGLR